MSIWHENDSYDDLLTLEPVHEIICSVKIRAWGLSIFVFSLKRHISVAVTWLRNIVAILYLQLT